MASRPEPIYMTADGVDALRQELETLLTVKRPALAERLRAAIQQGDLSENADYTTAKEEQGFLEGRIQQIEETLRRVRVIEETTGGERVALGCRVTVVEIGAEEPEETFQIVGSTEANPLNGRVSDQSPLGRSLLGRRVGEQVTVRAPNGESVFRIVAID